MLCVQLTKKKSVQLLQKKKLIFLIQRNFFMEKNSRGASLDIVYETSVCFLW